MATWNLLTADDAALARSAIGVNPNTDLYTEFADKADGAIPSVGDEGVAVTHRGGSLNNLRLVVADGLMQAPDLSGVPGDRGAYWNQALVGAKRIGATFKISSDNDDGGVVTLVFWEYGIPTPYKVPNSPFHLSVSSYSWALSVWEGGNSSTDATSTSIAGKTFETQLADDWNPEVAGSGTVHRVEAIIIGDTATIALPDGSIATVTDSRIESIGANVACHELYRNTTDSAHSAFQTIWADTDIGAPGAASQGEAARTAKTIARALNPLPVAASYEPASNSDITVPASFTDITGLPEITFTLPVDATAFEVEAYLYYEITAAAQILICFKSGASTYGTKTIANMSAYKGTLYYSAMRTGLTPGTGGTYTLQHRVATGTGAKLKLDAPNGYKAAWKITPVVVSS